MSDLKPVKKKEIPLNEFDIDQLSRYVIAAQQAETGANNYILMLGAKDHGFNLNNIQRVEYNIKTRSALIEEYDAKEFKKHQEERDKGDGPSIATV
jgi:hypothetical protein